VLQNDAGAAGVHCYRYSFARHDLDLAGFLYYLPVFFRNHQFTSCYIAVANYIMGYRLDNPPKWARWVVPKKWMDEWSYLIHAEQESIKSNRKGLIRVVGAATLLTILLLAFLSGKI
jgi:hypothetical protein